MIILAYIIVRGAALNIDEMETLTGLDNDTVRKAVKGLAAKNRLFKQMGSHGRTTWLPVGDTFFSLFEIQNPRFSDSGSTTTTTLMVGRKEDKSVVVINSGQSPKSSDSGTTQSPKSSDSGTTYLTHGVTFEKNLTICRYVGIGEPMATNISRMDHVSPELIKGHIDSLIPGETIGLAIRRIQGNEMPRKWLDEI